VSLAIICCKACFPIPTRGPAGCWLGQHGHRVKQRLFGPLQHGCEQLVLLEAGLGAAEWQLWVIFCIRACVGGPASTDGVGHIWVGRMAGDLCRTMEG
jgi:hypothetical protein